ncbi:uncharacterized protein LOC130664933 [Microplitis mediator]|uniref:Uncharacterized protein n=1 Tax=Microplitis mediator bracovirus TaxID=1836595 RepID=A0A1D5APG8_9VIRU|nr:uncharacterized protein LOC130664933 [Microplitis mediator]AOH69112.1 hypothetical protein A6F54_37 [Microplitis mediator bracovirus]
MPGNKYWLRCVPSHWVEHRHGKYVLTAYPPQSEVQRTINRVRDYEKPLIHWKSYPAIILHESDSYQTAMIYLIERIKKSIMSRSLKNLMPNPTRNSHRKKQNFSAKTIQGVDKIQVLKIIRPLIVSVLEVIDRLEQNGNVMETLRRNNMTHDQLIQINDLSSLSAVYLNFFRKTMHSHLNFHKTNQLLMPHTSVSSLYYAHKVNSDIYLEIQAAFVQILMMMSGTLD